MSRKPYAEDLEGTAQPPGSTRSTNDHFSDCSSEHLSNAMRRREERKKAKFAETGTAATNTTTSTPVSNNISTVKEEPEEEPPPDQEALAVNDRPGAFHVGTLDLDEETGTRFDDLSTLSPHTHHSHGVPITAQLVSEARQSRDGSNPNVENIVAEVLRQQLLQQQQQRPNAAEPNSGQSVSSPPPPSREDPKVVEAVVLQPKTICGITRSKFILGSTFIILLIGIGVALGIILGTEGGSEVNPGVVPPDQSPISPPTPINDPVEAPTPLNAPVGPPVKVPVDPPVEVPVDSPVEAPVAPVPAPSPSPTSPPTPAPGIQLQASLVGEHNGDRYGAYLEFSGDGNTFAVGASGSKPYVTILRASEGDSDWVFIGRIELGTSDAFGHRLDLDETGNTIVIGAPRNDDAGTESGKIQVFEYQGGTTWSQKGGDIDGFDTNDFFGWDVAMSDDGNTIVGTARLGDIDGIESGYAIVFSYDESSKDWIEVGSPLIGENEGDEFGRSCSISGDGKRVVIGATLGGGLFGRVYVYEYVNGSWNLLGQKLDGENPQDWQGTSVDISGDGNYVAIGSDGYDGVGVNSGVAKVYKLLGCCTWVPHGSFVYGLTAGEQFGSGHISISRDGQTLAVGALKFSGNQGIAYLYQFVSDNWRLVGQSVGEVSGDQYGFSASVSGDASRFAAGAPRPGDRPGYARIFSIE